MKTLTKAEADAIDPAALRGMGVHIRSTDDGVIIYESEAEIPVAPEVEPTPEPISAWKIRRVLNAAGLRGAVESYVSSADQDTQDAWEYAQEFERDHPLILGAQRALGVTDEQVDALWAMDV